MHFIPFDWVDSVEGGQVKLSRTALEAEDYWEHEGGENASESVSGSAKSYRKVAPENDQNKDNNQPDYRGKPSVIPSTAARIRAKREVVRPRAGGLIEK